MSSVDNINDRKGKCITFYSYKGGVGRSMALVNIACLLAKKEKKVLIVDWDVEAPGLDEFFTANKQTPGLVDLITEVSLFVNTEANNNEEGFARFFEENLYSYIDKDVSPIKGNSVKIDLMKAGRFDNDYTPRLNALDWQGVYKRSPALFRTFAYCLEKEYDYILIDSRTGLADTSGISAMLMPQKLILVFALNDQNINGVAKIAKQAIDYRFSSHDYRTLTIYPLPSRLENKGSDDLEYWTNKYRTKFEQIFTEKYLLDECNLTDYFERCQIPYAPIHAHGENIPVLKESVSNPFFISYFYNSFLTVLLKDIQAWDVVSLEKEVANEKEARELFFNGNKLLSNKNYFEAIELYNKSIELSPDVTEPYNNRGNAKYNLGDYDGATEDINQAIFLNPDNLNAYNNLGNVKIKMKDYMGAIDNYMHAVDIKPDFIEAHHNMGEAKLLLKDYNSAIIDFSKAIELGSEYAESFYYRAQCYLQLNKKEEALTDIKKAIELGSKEAKELYE